ncbi:hypothetical protein CKA32_003281 [Geitlerinema sp. FC II]|nr:hypothetical protein CKA32_003281 [Geitlerinema sp. FC II]
MTLTFRQYRQDAPLFGFYCEGNADDLKPSDDSSRIDSRGRSHRGKATTL